MLLDIEISILSDLIQLKAGDFYQGDIPSTIMITISSTKPIIVAQYIKPYEPLITCSISSVLPEPSNVMLPAIQDYTGNVTFHVLFFTIGGLQYYYINVVTKCEYVNGFIFDDLESMDSWEVLNTDDNKMCAIRGPVDVGTH